MELVMVLVNNELERMWRETVVVRFEVLIPSHVYCMTHLIIDLLTLMIIPEQYNSVTRIALHFLSKIHLQ
jgi:hypothetical protein